MPTRPNRPRPGFDPARGRPDPAFTPSAPPGGTHYPNRDRAVCGVKTSDPKAYDSVNPTCPACAQWLAAARRNTAAMVPRELRAPVIAQAADDDDEPAPSVAQPPPNPIR